jgi:hypothetical protein
MYFKFVSFIVFLFIWFGFVGPHCISGNTEFAIGYSIITLILIPFTFKLFKKELLMFKNFLSNEIIEYEKVINQRIAIEKWNRALPQVMASGSVPFINVK